MCGALLNALGSRERGSESAKSESEERDEEEDHALHGVDEVWSG